MKGGLENNFFLRIALRFIESRRGFWLAEDVRDPVIADAVTGAEISVRVVIKRAPADAAGVLRIGRKLVVNSGMPQSVLGQALDIIDRFRGIGMPDEFCVEVARMVRRLQREAKIIHRENIFKKF